MMKTDISLKKAIALHLRAIRELHKISPRFFPILTLYCIIGAVAPYVTVFFSAKILSELALLRRADVLWMWVVLGVASMGVCGLLKAFLYRRQNTLLNDLYGRKEILFIHKMFELDYSALDKQETHDLRAQIQQNENWGGWGLMETCEIYEKFLRSIIGILSGIVLTMSLFTSSVPKSAGSLTVLNHPIFAFLLAFLMVAVSVLAGSFNAKAVSLMSDHSQEATLANRIFSFFGFLGEDPKRSVDIRMSNQQEIINNYWARDTAFGTNGRVGRLSYGKMGIYESLGACISVLVTGFVYIFTCLKALGGAFDVGSITQYVAAATTMNGSVFELTESLGYLKTNSEYLIKTFAFLDIPNAMYQGSLTSEKRSDRKYEVEFKDVSFKYPGSDVWSLRHVNMKFKIGKRLAIVGENGSGKTTFIKLLCRLYDPQEGVILLNGIDIRKYRYDDYMHIFSIVFQDFQLISQPLGANVAGSSDYDRERVVKALIDAGFGERLATMDKGLDTMIYKKLSQDGVDVSGGEAQKIAIARALYKDAPFIILDEPTAALDPIAEAEIYSKFNEISGDKTAIYISHRLSSCKFCDEIAVFQDGKVVQQGTHESLVGDEGGKYYELWHAQAQYYTE